MKLTTEQLKSIYCGALFFKENDEGWLEAYQYSEEQMEYLKGASQFWYERSYASTAKTLEFVTDASHFSFEYNLVWLGSPDSVELFIDGNEADVRLVKELFDKFPPQLPVSGSMRFDLPDGEKTVTLYLPADATMLIKNVEIDGSFKPAPKGEKVLWIGDSITQGFGPLRSAYTYVSIANRSLNYDIINQGIGGYVYDKNVIKDLGYRPDKIIIAMGTNQCGDKTMDAVEDYYKLFTELYGSTPILCITPIWRNDFPGSPEVLANYSKGIKDVVSKYPNITVVDGYELIPHESEYYLDNLHPNVEGCKLYAENLVKAIRACGF